MIIKKVIWSISLLFFINISYGQQKHIFYDADSIPIGIFYISNEKVDSTIYWDLEKNKFNVQFTGECRYKYGFDSLKSLIIKQFRQMVNYEEINDVALVYVLMDKGKITEIRIGKRINNNSKYDSIIKEILTNTQKDWILPDKIEKPLLLPYLFKVR